VSDGGRDRNPDRRQERRDCQADQASDKNVAKMRRPFEFVFHEVKV